MISSYILHCQLVFMKETLKPSKFYEYIYRKLDTWDKNPYTKSYIDTILDSFVDEIHVFKLLTNCVKNGNFSLYMKLIKRYDVDECQCVVMITSSLIQSILKKKMTRHVSVVHETVVVSILNLFSLRWYSITLHNERNILEQIQTRCYTLYRIPGWLILDCIGESNNSVFFKMLYNHVYNNSLKMLGVSAA